MWKMWKIQVRDESTYWGWFFRFIVVPIFLFITKIDYIVEPSYYYKLVTLRVMTHTKK